MLKEKLTLDEYNELGEFSVNQIENLEIVKFYIYFLVPTITLNEFNTVFLSDEV